jgi:hypothetical protein
LELIVAGKRVKGPGTEERHIERCYSSQEKAPLDLLAYIALACNFIDYMGSYSSI